LFCEKSFAAEIWSEDVDDAETQWLAGVLLVIWLTIFLRHHVALGLRQHVMTMMMVVVVVVVAGDP